jgi:uncharacterized membrane protein
MEELKSDAKPVFKIEDLKNDAKLVFGHVKEECIKDPLYFTKIILAVFGSNLLGIVLRIAAYLLGYYVMATYLGISSTIAWLITLIAILVFNSSKTVLKKIKDGAKNGKQNP